MITATCSATFMWWYGHSTFTSSFACRLLLEKPRVKRLGRMRAPCHEDTLDLPSFSEDHSCTPASLHPLSSSAIG